MAKLVLLVEDHLLTQHVTQMLLESYGFEVDVATTGEEALQKSGVKQFDCILVDLGLPDRDGLELVTHLKSYQNDAKFIAITSCADSKLLHEACSKGYITLLEKPLTEYSGIGGTPLREFLQGI